MIGGRIRLPQVSVGLDARRRAVDDVVLEEAARDQSYVDWMNNWNSAWANYQRIATPPPSRSIYCQRLSRDTIVCD